MDSARSSEPAIALLVSLDEILRGIVPTRIQRRFTVGDLAATRRAIDIIRDSYEKSVVLLEQVEADPEASKNTREQIREIVESNRRYIRYLRRDRDTISQMSSRERLAALVLVGPTFFNVLRLHRYLKRVLDATIDAVEARDRSNRERWELAVKLDPSLAEGAQINASNYDPAEFIAADLSKVPPRPTPRLG